MKKKIIVAILFIVLLTVLFFAGCRQPSDPGPEPPKIVAIGDSITMGTQDAGLTEDSQKHNYPYLIAQQVGAARDYQQPYLLSYSDGIGTPPYKKPFTLSGGTITATYWTPAELADPDAMEQYIIEQFNPFSLILQRPYDNLGINGARLINIRTTERSTEPQALQNYFFDIVLRNLLHDSEPLVPELGSVVEQAALLKPDYIMLWIGNNDILHVVLNGGGVNESEFSGADPPTTAGDFATEYGLLLDDLKAITDRIVMSSIPNYLPFVSALDGIKKIVSGFGDEPVPCVFDPLTFEPVDFDDDDTEELYIPLLLEEAGAPHLLLSGAIMYMDLDEDDAIDSGLGIPDQAALEAAPYNFSDSDAGDLVTAMEGLGLSPGGLPLPGNFTLTAEEEVTAQGFIDSYNSALSALSISHDVPLVDIKSAWWDEGDFGGYSGLHALQDKDNTTFSLDGVHPNNLGHALCANAFIDVLNSEYGLSIPQLNPDQYAGQYSSKSIQAEGLKALKRVIEF